MTARHRRLDEQVVVVFGATSGIGRATAVKAVERGARVMATGRDEDALASLQSEWGNDGALMTMVAEATRPEQVEAVAEGTVATFGRLDSWCHVAGIGQYARFEDITPDEFRRVIDVDLLGPVWGARAALPHLRRQGGAYIVVSSAIAKRAFPLASSYSAAKHGVDGFVEALRVELQHEAIERDGRPEVSATQMTAIEHDGRPEVSATQMTAIERHGRPEVSATQMTASEVDVRPEVSVTQIMPAAVSTPFFEHARTRLGVRPSGPPPVYDPDTIADAILHAAEHGGRDVAVGAATKVQLALQRVSPRIMDAFARATAFRLQRSDEPKQPGDDALFDAPSGDDRVRGVVTTTQR